MLFKFKRDKFKDVVKVVDFLEKEGIEYEVTTDIEVALGGATTSAPVEQSTAESNEPKMVPTVERVRATNSNPLWRVARHDNETCSNMDCLDNTHLGAVPVGS